GDFNADGNADVVTAARGSDKLYWMAGDGHGALGKARPFNLPGLVTALTSGDINRSDGLADLVVGVTGRDGPKLLVFESRSGALRGDPEVLPLPGEATAIELG